MGKHILRMVLPVTPRTKKNSGNIVNVKGRTILLPSKAYKEMEGICKKLITGKHRLMLDRPVTVKVLFVMPTRRRGDLVGLLQAIDDVLEVTGVLANDKWVYSHDGSRQVYEKDKIGRIEIDIFEFDE